MIYLTPEQLTGIGEMQAAVMTFTTNRNEAERFLEFLASGEGKETFRECGYIVDEEEMELYS